MKEKKIHLYPSLVKYPLLLGFLFLSLFPFRQSWAETSSTTIPQLILRLGQNYPLEGVWPEKAEIHPDYIAKLDQRNSGFVIIPLKPGEATLSLIQEGKKIDVHLVVKAAPTNEMPSSNSFKKETGMPKGLKTKIIDGKNIIEGTVFSRAVYQKLLFLEKKSNGTTVLKIRTSPFLKQSLVELAENQLRNSKLQDLKIQFGGNCFFLTGNVESPEQVDIALEVASAVIPNIQNQIATPIRIDPTIMMRIFMLELSKSAHENLGLSWPASTTAFLLSPFQTAQRFLFNPSWLTTLRHLKNSGQAKVLAEPVLGVKSGASAELVAGGEIPIKLTGHFENKVVWKNYGLKIKIQVLGFSGKTIRTKIETESSQLDEATAVDGVPGIKTNKMGTEIDAKANFPVLLTGLFQSSTSDDIESMPGLGSIPILGELFKSKNFRNRESELLVVLLPSFGAEKGSVTFRE